MKKLDILDRVALTLYNSKGIIEDHMDYSLSIVSEKEGIITVLVEEPTYFEREWKTTRAIYEVFEDGKISEKKRLSDKDPIVFSDLKDDEFLKGRVYNFVKDSGTLYIERKQPSITEKRRIEEAKILYDYKKKEIIISYQRKRLLSDCEPVMKYSYPSRYGYTGYAGNFDEYYPIEEDYDTEEEYNWMKDENHLITL